MADSIAPAGNPVTTAMFEFASKGALSALVVDMLENELEVVKLVLVMLELVL